MSDPSRASAAGPSARGRWDPLATVVLAGALYVATGARDVLWGEPTKLALLLHDLRLDLAQWSHAGSLLLVWPVTKLPIEPFAQRVHLASAVCGALALGLVHASLLRRGLPRAAAAAGVAAAGVAHTIWLTSAMAENYAPVLLLLALAARLLVGTPRPLLAGLVLGFAALAHPIALFGVPAIALATGRGPGGAGRLVRVALGLGVGWVLPAVAIAATGDGAASEMRWGTVLERYTDPALPLRNAPLLAGLLVYGFAGAALVLLAVGLARLAPWERRVALVFAAVHYAVALAWIPQRAWLIPAPVYLAAAWPIAVGARVALERPRVRPVPLLAALVAVPPLVYAVAVLAAGGLAARAVRDVPHRDEAAYFLEPWKAGDRSARAWIREVDAAVPAPALVVGDFTLLTPLRYASEVEGWRPDLELLPIDHLGDDAILARMDDALAEGRAVVVLQPALPSARRAAEARGRLVAGPGTPAVPRLVPALAGEGGGSR